jgi:rhodanese-related sulfurtransferase
MNVPLSALLVIQTLGVPGDPLREAHEAPSHYCGILCVHAAAQALGREGDFTRLLDPRFIQGKRGSTVADIRAALDHRGIPDHAARWMSLESLRNLRYPAILHVRAPCGGAEYTHWVLFLGWTADGRIRLYDPPRDHGDLAPEELLAMWDGIGIVVGNKNTSAAAFALMAPGTALILASVFALLVVSSFRPEGWWNLPAAAVIAAAGIHGFTPMGFLRVPRAVQQVAAAHFPADEARIQQLDLATTSRLMADRKCRLIDARQSAAFQRFHLPGAINIPVDSSLLRFAREVESLRGQERVIVYCQNIHCQWAKKVADQLLARGVVNVGIFAGGVNEWKSACHS